VIPSIDRDAWLRALEEVGISDTTDDQALTVAEFCALMGLRVTAAYRRLQALQKAGKAIRTRKRITDKAGRYITLSAYRLLEESPHVQDTNARPRNARRRRRD
jgi:hypothetical protein